MSYGIPTQVTASNAASLVVSTGPARMTYLTITAPSGSQVWPMVFTDTQGALPSAGNSNVALKPGSLLAGATQIVPDAQNVQANGIAIGLSSTPYYYTPVASTAGASITAWFQVYS